MFQAMSDFFGGAAPPGGRPVLEARPDRPPPGRDDAHAPNHKDKYSDDGPPINSRPPRR